MSAQRVRLVPRPVDPVIADLRALRVKANLSQAEVAGLIGAKQRALSSWESGVNTPDFPTVRQWAAALGVDLRLGELSDASPAQVYARGWDDCAAAAVAAVKRGAA